MMKRVVFWPSLRVLFLSLLLSVSVVEAKAQVMETEPNDRSNEAGVITITAAGSYTGSINTTGTGTYDRQDVWNIQLTSRLVVRVQAIGPSFQISFAGESIINNGAFIEVTLEPGTYSLFVFELFTFVPAFANYRFDVSFAIPNDPPVVTSGEVTFNEGQAYTFSESDFNYSDPNGDPVTYFEIAALPANGSLFRDVNNNGIPETAVPHPVAPHLFPNLSFNEFAQVDGQMSAAQLAANEWKYFQEGTTASSFTFSAFGGNLASGTATMTLTPNTRPTLVNLNQSTNEDTPFSFTQGQFTAAFTDTEGAALDRVRVASLPMQGTLALNGVAVTVNQEIPLANLGTLTYTPAYNFNGSDSFTYNASDGALFAASNASVNLTINAVNDAPVAGSGTALTFDGIDDRVSIPDHSALNPTHLTLEAWVTSPNWSSLYFPMIVAKGVNVEYLLMKSDDFFDEKFAFRIGLHTVYSTTTAQNDTWYHLAASYDGNEAILYVNGVEEGRATFGVPIPDGTNPLTIGEAGTLALNGTVDEVRIWNDVRTAAEIVSNRYVPLVGNESNLVAYYRFDEGANGVLHDATSNKLDGVLTNMDPATDWINSDAWKTRTIQEDIPLVIPTTGYDPDGTALTTSQSVAPTNGRLSFGSLTYTPRLHTSGNDSFTYQVSDGVLTDTYAMEVTVQAVNDAPVAGSGTALTFDGTDDRVSILDHSALNPTHLTLEAWVTSPNWSSLYFPMIVAKGVNVEYLLMKSDDFFDEKFAFRIGLHTVYSTTTAQNDTWYHLAASYDGNEAILYVNGVEEGRATFGVPIPDGTNPLTIGEAGTLALNGTVDEVRIWNDVRTAAEIVSNRYVPLVGNESNLVAYYRFDEGANGVLHDATSNKLDGVLTNMDPATDWVSSDAWKNRRTPRSTSLVFQRPAYDPEGSPLSYSATGAPTNGGLTFGALRYSPLGGFQGTDAFTYRASDGVLTDDFAISVAVDMSSATAATLTVNTSADNTTASDGQCTLREAIANANSDSEGTGGDCVAGSGTDTITFDASLSGQTIALNGTELSLASDLTISAAALTSGLIVSGGNASRVFNQTSGTVTLSHVSIQGGSASSGSGILNAGTLTLNNSTLSGNTTTGNGGGISNMGTLTINNSTLSGNTATGNGGGVSNTGTLMLNNATLSNNAATGNGGGLYLDSGTLHLKNTILANSTSADCFNNTGTLATNTNNLIEDNSCSPAVSGDPNLGLLTSNGGPTQTHALQVGSPAINAGDAATCAALPNGDFDQRQAPRNGTCDIGAVEFDSAPLPVELVEFSALRDGSRLHLTWHTASETNNAGFELQYRQESTIPTDLTWDVYAWIEGAGTSTDGHRYQHRMDDLLPGVYRFRLKQIDFDGQFVYSPEVEVQIELPGGYATSGVYPNPFQRQGQFTFMVAQTQVVRIEVYDALGRRRSVLHDGLMQADTNHRFILDGQSLSSGTYFIRTRGETFAATQTAIVAY